MDSAAFYVFSANRRGIKVYIEHQSVCPLVGIGSSTSSTANECVSPLVSKGREQYSLAGDQVGGPTSDDLTESLAHIILCCM
jgi:hypothetical protein